MKIGVVAAYSEIVDEKMEITIVELCRTCAVDAELVEAMIDEGIIEPTRKRGAEWCFAWHLGIQTTARMVTN